MQDPLDALVDLYRRESDQSSPTSTFQGLGDDPEGTLRKDAARFGLSVTSAGRTPERNRAVGGAKRSYHLNRQALDISGEPQKMREFTTHLSNTYGPNLAELFHDPVGGWKQGKSIGAIGKHSDHVHVAWQGKQGAVIPRPVIGQQEVSAGSLDDLVELYRRETKTAPTSAKGGLPGAKNAQTGGALDALTESLYSDNRKQPDRAAPPIVPPNVLPQDLNLAPSKQNLAAIEGAGRQLSQATATLNQQVESLNQRAAELDAAYQAFNRDMAARNARAQTGEATPDLDAQLSERAAALDQQSRAYQMDSQRLSRGTQQAEFTGQRFERQQAEYNANVARLNAERQAPSPTRKARPDAVSKRPVLQGYETKGDSRATSPPVADPLAANSQPVIGDSYEVTVSGGGQMSEDEVYREWYNARQQGNTYAQSLIARSYLEQFPQGKYAKVVTGEQPRGTSVQDARTQGAGGTFPVAEIERARAQGMRDDEILRGIQNTLARQMGLSDSDIEVLTQKHGQHPLANIVEPGTDARSSVDSIIRQGRSNAGVAQFLIRPETVEMLRRDTLSLTSPSTASAKAAALNAPSVRDNYYETEAERKRDPQGWLAYLKEVGKDRAEDLLRQVAYERPLTGEEAEAAGLNRSLLNFNNAAWRVFSGASNVIAPAVTYLGALTKIEGLEELGTQAAKAIEAEANLGSDPERLGSQFLSGAGSMAAFATTPGGSIGSGVMGSLSSAGQAYQEMVDRGVSKADAKRLALLFVPAGALEAIGVNNASILNQLKKQGVKTLAREVAKELIKGGSKETAQELTQNIMTDWVARGVYDPNRNVFDWQKMGDTALVSFLLGGLAEGGARAVSGIRNVGAEGETEVSPTIREQVRAQIDTLTGRRMPSVVTGEGQEVGGARQTREEAKEARRQERETIREERFQEWQQRTGATGETPTAGGDIISPTTAGERTQAGELQGVTSAQEVTRGESPTVSSIDIDAEIAATGNYSPDNPPTEAQKKAGNYQKAHVKVGGLDIAIENPEGTRRRPEWPELKSHYGYIKRTAGGDSEQIDVFIKPGTETDYEGPVFVVDQTKKDGGFDEHKVMLGFDSEKSARQGYAENFTKGWKVGQIRQFDSVADFKDWLKTADTTKPASLPSGVTERQGAIVSESEQRVLGVEGVVKRAREERRQAARQLDTDALTGVQSARAFHAAKDHIDRDPNREWVTIDLNNFKAVNDTLGHPEGDARLKKVGEAMNEVRARYPQAQAFRTGGDEFSFAAPKGQAERIAREIEEAIGAETLPNGRVFSASATTGNTYAQADTKLEAAKLKRKAKLGGVQGKREATRADLKEATAKKREKAKQIEEAARAKTVEERAVKRAKPASKERDIAATAKRFGAAPERVERFYSAFDKLRNAVERDEKATQVAARRDLVADLHSSPSNKLFRKLFKAETGIALSGQQKRIEAAVKGWMSSLAPKKGESDVDISKQSVAAPVAGATRQAEPSGSGVESATVAETAKPKTEAEAALVEAERRKQIAAARKAGGTKAERSSRISPPLAVSETEKKTPTQTKVLREPSRTTKSPAAQKMLDEGTSIAEQIKRAMAEAKDKPAPEAAPKDWQIAGMTPQQAAAADEALFVFDGDYIATNLAGAKALTAIFKTGEQADVEGFVRGLTFTGAQAEKYAARALVESRKAANPVDAENLRLLAGHLRDAAQSREEFAIGLPRVKSHEVFHVAQVALKRFFARDIDAADVRRLPQYNAVAKGLAAKGYSWATDPAIIAHEASAHIAGGQREDLELSRRQALEFLDGYFKLIARTYKTDALKRFNALNEEYGRLRDAVYEAITKEQATPRFTEAARSGAARAVRAVRGSLQRVEQGGQRGTAQADRQEREGGRALADAARANAEKVNAILLQIAPTSKQVTDEGRFWLLSDGRVAEVPRKSEHREIAAKAMAQAGMSSQSMQSVNQAIRLFNDADQLGVEISNGLTVEQAEAIAKAVQANRNKDFSYVIAADTGYKTGDRFNDLRREPEWRDAQYGAMVDFEGYTRKDMGLAGETVFKESDYRISVVRWAKDKWGDRKAPDGSVIWQNFTEWFGDSKVVDEKGEPLVVYHGTPNKSFSAFGRSRNQETPFYVFSENREIAERFASGTFNDIDEMRKGEISGVYEVYLSVQNPFDPEIHGQQEVLDFLENGGQFQENTYNIPSDVVVETIQRGNWRWIEDPDFLQHIKNKGYDGFYVAEPLRRYGPAVKNIGVFSPTQIKSVDNRGTFDPNDPNILADFSENIPLSPAVIVGLRSLTRLYLDAGGGNISELFDTFEELLGQDTFDAVIDYLPQIVEAEESLLQSAQEKSDAQQEAEEYEISEEAAARPLQPSRQPSAQTSDGAETKIAIPGSGREYAARYQVRELSDVHPSHDPQTFQLNPRYELVNDRRYDREKTYQQEVIANSTREAFKPQRLINNSDTAEVGPPVIDQNGNVLGGNSRTMMVSRLYSAGAGGHYKGELMKQAKLYGIDSKAVAAMKQPVLVRLITDEALSKQEAITDLNVSGTRALTPQERAVAEAGRLSDSVVDYIAQKIESAGDDATLSQVLDRSGVEIVNRLINEAVFGSQERNALIKDGKLLPEAKTRIERMMLGRIFRDLDQLDRTPDNIRRNMERIVAPILRIEGESEWDILEELRNAIDLVTDARAAGSSNLDDYARQTSMFRSREYTSREVALGKSLGLGVVKTAKAFRFYANEAAMAKQGGGLFGASTPEQAFKDAFGLQEKSVKSAHNVAGSRTDLEPDSGVSAQNPSVQEALSPERRGVDRRDAAGGRNPEGTRLESANNQSGSRIRPVADRESGDQAIRREEPAIQTGTAGDQLDTAGFDDGSQPVPTDARLDERVRESSERPNKLGSKRDAQRDAESTPVKLNDLDNIRKTLPFLLPEQQEDVYLAEQRFTKPDGYGFLFTNGTGTGKTYTGLGVIKRFERQGKTNILIVAPNDKIMEDWILSGQNLGLNVTALRDTADSGSGIAITTYANFGQNNELVKRKWDMIVADESHHISSEQSGEETERLKVLRAITLHPDGEYQRNRMRFPEKYAELDEARRRKDMKAQRRIFQEIAALEAPFRDEIKNTKPEDRSRVLFLSATPFAYRKSVKYAQGYLFDWDKGQVADGYRSYNSGSNEDRFFMTHFGYRMRYNKLTEPEAEVNTDLLEQEFHEWLKQEGVLSGRALEVDPDYERKFVYVEGTIGDTIDQGLEWMRTAEDGRFHGLWEVVIKRFTYLRRQYLLEAIKAKGFVPLIKKQIALGRKVVVFHNYNKGGGFHPFRLERMDKSPFTGETVTISYQDKNGKTITRPYNDVLDEFEAARPDLISLDFSSLRSPIVTFKKEFPDALFLNGSVPKTERRQNVRRFNDDDSGANLIVMQADAGREGISVHDVTGKHARVLFNLGLPTRPVASTQTEGRIYRTGQVSDATFVYGTTGTSFERFAFAQTIAGRSATAENLALGSAARQLKQSFIDGYIDAVEGYEPSLDEGKGGKAKDRASRLEFSPFEKAKTYYFQRAKKTSQTKAQEGVDYFATPEPLGLKMVEWAGIRANEKALEPSAGHGAISRFFPEFAERTVVEPSRELATKAALVSGGARIVEDQFENLHISNKYDAIVMNPPFGHGGKTAIEHLEKATQHLRDGGRVVALLPEGPAADKRLEKWLYGDDESAGVEHIYKVADIHLPSVTFERAGTRVKSHIIILEKQTQPLRAARIQRVERDLSDIDGINALFDRIEEMSVPQREHAPEQTPSPAAVAPQATRPSVAGQDLSSYEVKEFLHTKNRNKIFVARAKAKLLDFAGTLATAKKHGGRYSNFKGAGAVPGFHFDSAEQRQAFLNEVTGTSDVPMADLASHDKIPPMNRPDEPGVEREEGGTGKEAQPDVALTLDHLWSLVEIQTKSERLSLEEQDHLSYLEQQTGFSRFSSPAPSVYGVSEPTLRDRVARVQQGRPISQGDEGLEAELTQAITERDQLRRKRDMAETEWRANLSEKWEKARAEGRVVFVRFGSPPKTGKSRNYRDDFEEGGVSVYEAIEHEKGIFEMPSSATSAIGFASGFTDRPLYRITGEIVGQGSDGEPVVTVTKSVRIRDYSIFNPIAGWAHGGVNRDILNSTSTQTAKIPSDDEDVLFADLFSAANQSTEDMSRIEAKFKSLQQQAKREGRPVKIVIDEYLRQGGLFGGEFTPEQEALLRAMASQPRRERSKAEQGALFDTSPTLESELEKRKEREKSGGGFTGQGGLPFADLVAPSRSPSGLFTPKPPPPTALSGGLTNAVKSGWDKFLNLSVRNLSHLRRVRPEAHTATLRAAGSRGQATILLAIASSKISKLLEGSGIEWADVRATLVESRLRGIRDRYQGFADDVYASSEDELSKALEHGLLNVLTAIEGKAGLDDTLAQRAASLLTNGDFDGLRDFLGETFEIAASLVGESMAEADFNRITTNPKFDDALRLYKELIERPVAESHAINEGVFSTSLGPLDTYYPLVAVKEDGGILRRIFGGTKFPYRKPKNIANFFATGLSERGYSSEMEDFSERIQAAIRANNKANLLAELDRQGLIRVLSSKEKSADSITIDGVETAATTVDVGADLVVVRDGQSRRIPGARAVVPDWLHKELRLLLDKEKMEPGMGQSIADKIINFSLIGPMDLVFHSTNVLGTLTANTPFIGRSLLGKTVGNLAFTKWLTAIMTILRADPTSEAGIKDLIEMAKLGLIPKRYASVASAYRKAGRRYAEQTGAEKSYSTAPLLYGLKGLDIRARLVLYRTAKQINPSATPQQLFDFVSQLGIYNRELESAIERWAKASRLAPFATAGTTMLRNGLAVWTGMSPVPTNSKAKRVAYKVASQLSGGAAGLILMWALAYKYYRDEWPWEDEEAKLLQIPLKDEDRNSALGKILYGPDPTKTAYVNFAFFSPVVSRGARGLGLTGAFETRQLGGSTGQQIEYAQRDILNAFSHPFTSGPLVRAPFIFATGREPSLTGLRDTTGQFGPQFFPATIKAAPGLPALRQRAQEAILNINPIVQGGAAMASIGREADLDRKREGEQPSRWVRMITDIAAPRLLGGSVDNLAKRERLARERQAAESQPAPAAKLPDDVRLELHKREIIPSKPPRKEGESDADYLRRSEDAGKEMASRIRSLKESDDYKALPDAEKKAALKRIIEDARRDRAQAAKGEETEMEAELLTRRNQAEDEARARLARREDFQTLSEEQKKKVSEELTNYFTRYFSLKSDERKLAADAREQRARGKKAILDAFLRGGRVDRDLEVILLRAKRTAY